MNLKRVLSHALMITLYAGAAFAVNKGISVGTNGVEGGFVKLLGATSGDATIQTPDVAGTATLFQLPGTMGSNGQGLITNGSGVLSWGAVGGTGCTVSGTGAVLSASGTCSVDTSITATAGALSLGASGTVGSVTMGNATSGTVKLATVAGALGTVTQSFQAATGTVADLDVASQVVSGGATVTALSQSAGNITVDCGARPLQYMANNGAFTITAPANDGYCVLDVENGASAGTITTSGFVPNAIGGATVTTTNGQNFRLHISRNHGHASIFAVALQ